MVLKICCYIGYCGMESQFCSSIMMNLGIFPVRFRGNMVLREITELIDYRYKIPNSLTDELWRLSIPVCPSDLHLSFLENAVNVTHAIYVTAQCSYNSFLCLNYVCYICSYWMSVPFAFHNFSNLSKSTESKLILPSIDFPFFLSLCSCILLMS